MSTKHSSRHVSRVHVAVGVVNQTPFAWAENERNLRDIIADARARGVTLLSLPELCITGYGCEDMFQASGLLRRAWEMLEALTPESAGMAFTLGLPVEHQGAIYNCAALCVDGDIAGLYAKRFLAGDGIHYEPRWFRAWPEGKRAELRRGARRFPIGDLSFDLGGLKIGFEICEDAWVAARPGVKLAAQGVDVILNPSASHFAFGKQDVRRQIVVEGSRAFGVTYLYANLLGNEAGRAVYDGGGIIAVAGKPIAETHRFSFAPYSLADAIADIDSTRLGRARSVSYEPEVVGRHLEIDFTWPHEKPIPLAGGGHEAIELVDYSKEEAFARVIALALFDYLRKARSWGYVVSLSGGADSAACAYLVRLALEIPARELGVAGLKARLPHWEKRFDAIGADTDVLPVLAELMKRSLTTAYQGTRNSSETTRDAADAVAEAAGADHFEIDVDEVVQRYVGLAERALGRALEWERDDLALQNIQARTRSPSIWLLANVRGQILLSTSNRSEAAVGYATMDGDTSGGVSPIAGIDKAFLRRWLRWLETEGLPEIGPVPAMRLVNEQQPTAELRPTSDAGEAQTDEADLMPYPVLDAIERHAIRDKKMPLEAFEKLQIEFPEYDAATLEGWVERFYLLWCRNQWKRERYAVSFHVDDKNLDPKTWCRFPVLSGGYAEELELLKRRE